MIYKRNIFHVRMEIRITKMEHFLLFLTLVICCTALEISSELEPLEIEKYIPSNLHKSCTAVIFSETKTDFYPIKNRPVMLLTKKYDQLTLLKHCNILVIPNFNSVKDSLSGFVLENEINTFVALTYSTAKAPLTIKQVRTYIRKLDVVLIDLERNTSKLFKYPIDCKNSLKCLMKRRSLRIGYTSVSKRFSKKNLCILIVKYGKVVISGFTVFQNE